MAVERKSQKSRKPKKSRKPPKSSAAKKTIKVTLVRSVINTRSDHRATVRGLGLRRLNHTVELEDTPAVRGMINKVGYLLTFEG
jgi:large subunit ribosomal protein L30